MSRSKPPFNQANRIEVLTQFCRAVAAARQNRPHDLALAWRLAHLHRALGALEMAATEYQHIAEAQNDVRAACYAQLMRGDPAPPPQSAQGPYPAPFLRLSGLLPEEAQARLWAALEGRRADFTPAGVYKGGHDYVDPAMRNALSIGKNQGEKEILLPFVQAAIAKHRVVERLGLSPVGMDMSEFEMVSFLDGGFLLPHCDSLTTGPLSRRHLSYVYYFHRRPARFAGGELALYDGNGGNPFFEDYTRLFPTHDSLVFFPSASFHAVLPVATDSADPLDGRMVATGFFHKAG